jgi:hypothetical protein
VSPFLDRIEIPAQAGALRGEGTLADRTHEEIADLFARARKANPTAPMSIAAAVAVGASETVAPFVHAFGNGIFSGLAGDPSTVARALSDLSQFGVDRCTVVELVPGSYALLAREIFG